MEQKSKRAIVTNFMMVAGADGESVRSVGGWLSEAYAIERVSFTNVDTEDIDNTGGAYAYDENYRNLRYSLLNIGESKGTSALLCQFTTDAELTEEDMLAIQSANNGLFAVINRWHLKLALDWQNPFSLSSEAAGYFSVIDGEVSQNERRLQISDLFMEYQRDNGIDAFGPCPQCGENSSMSYLHVNKVCPDCNGGMKNTLLASIGASLEKSDLDWSKGENLCAGDGCYASVKGAQGAECPKCGLRFCPDCIGSHVCKEE